MRHPFSCGGGIPPFRERGHLWFFSPCSEGLGVRLDKGKGNQTKKSTPWTREPFALADQSWSRSCFRASARKPFPFLIFFEPLYRGWWSDFKTNLCIAFINLRIFKQLFLKEVSEKYIWIIELDKIKNRDILKWFYLMVVIFLRLTICLFRNIISRNIWIIIITLESCKITNKITNIFPRYFKIQWNDNIQVMIKKDKVCFISSSEASKRIIII